VKQIVEKLGGVIGWEKFLDSVLPGLRGCDIHATK